MSEHGITWTMIILGIVFVIFVVSVSRGAINNPDYSGVSHVQR